MKADKTAPQPAKKKGSPFTSPKAAQEQAQLTQEDLKAASFKKYEMEMLRQKQAIESVLDRYSSTKRSNHEASRVLIKAEITKWAKRN